MKYTIEDVAREAGVSITTVSRVLNGNYPVKKETKERIQEAIKKLGYQPNPVARSLVKGKTNSIAVIVPDIRDEHCSNIIYSIEKYFREYKYNIFLSNSEYSPEGEKKCIESHLERFVDGIIIVEPQSENIESGYYDELLNTVPVIFVCGDCGSLKHNCVQIDEEMGIRYGIEYLINIGHKKIALVRRSRSADDKKEAIYKEYMDGLKKEPIIIASEGKSSTDIAEDAGNKLVSMHRYEYRIIEDVTAFFTCDSILLAGTLNGCKKLNVKIPGDVSIVSFGNASLTEIVSPKITSIDINADKLGETAGERLLYLIESRETCCSNYIVEAGIRERDSCREIKRGLSHFKDDYLL